MTRNDQVTLNPIPMRFEADFNLIQSLLRSTFQIRTRNSVYRSCIFNYLNHFKQQ